MVVFEVSHLEMFLLVICFWLGILLWVFLVDILLPSHLSCLLLVKEIWNAAVWSTLCHLVILMGILRGTSFLLEILLCPLGSLVWRDIGFLLVTSFVLLGIEPDAFVHLEFWIVCLLLFLVHYLLVDHVIRLHEHSDMQLL